MTKYLRLRGKSKWKQGYLKAMGNAQGLVVGGYGLRLDLVFGSEVDYLRDLTLSVSISWANIQIKIPELISPKQYDS